MIEIRIHGRGGQGAVLASKILAVAFFKEQKYVQSFPMFGVERRGAPVVAFTRVDTSPVRIRMNIYHPDHIIVLDPTLIQTVDVTQGLKFRGTVLLNMKGSLTEVQRFRKFRLGLIDAGEIAVKNGLGTPTNPIVNTTILGAFSRFSGLVKLESILSAIEEEAPFNPEANINAAKEAYQRVTFLNE